MSTPKTILVIDVECTCWENLPPNKFPDTRNEIIEIGITPIDLKSRLLGMSEAIIVIPKTQEISAFCTQLTTLTPEFVYKHGVAFEDAMNILVSKYRMNRNIFASWGEYDRKSFEKNCTWNKVPFPFNNLHLNVKALFAAKFGYTGGVSKIAADVGLPFEGTYHRGADDSRMIAKILLKLL